jgi:acetyl esterase/lipase
VSDGIEVRRDLVFAEPAGQPLQLDLYRPAGDGEVPVCVYLHGGGWARGSRTDRAEDRLVPVARSGIAVASVDYRLTDTATFPAQLEDARAAVRWLRAHGAEHGLATGRIGAWGASAGGHLAALLGLCPDVADPQLGDGSVQGGSVQGVVAWFPPTDLLRLETDEPEGPPPPFRTGPPPSPSFEARLLGLSAASDDPARARAASPLTHVRPDAPPFLVVHGDRDGLIPSVQSRRLVEALSAAGATADLMLLAGANHEDPAFDTPGSLGAVSGFLRTVLAEAPRS